MLRHIQKHALQRTGGEKVLDIFGMGERCRRFLSCEQCGTLGGLEGHVCNVYFAPLGVCLKMDIFFAMLIKTTPNHPSIFPQTSVVFVDSTRCFFVVLDGFTFNCWTEYHHNWWLHQTLRCRKSSERNDPFPVGNYFLREKTHILASYLDSLGSSKHCVFWRPPSWFVKLCD